MRPASPVRAVVGDKGSEIRLTLTEGRAPLPGWCSIRSAPSCLPTD
jgi:hypothetical protein